MQPAELLRVRLDSAHAPEEALLALRGDRRPFALTGRWAGGGAIVGSEPLSIAAPGADPLDVLDRQPAVETRCPPGDAVGGGWFGYLAYGAGGLVERLPPSPPRPVPLPFASWAFYDHVLRLDSERVWWFEALVTPSRRALLAARLAALRERLAAAPPVASPFHCGDFRPHPGEAGYRRAVETCLRHIDAGDLYQANLALRLEATLSGSGLDVFARAGTTLAPDRAAYLSGAGADLICLSPELFLNRKGRTVTTAPIKGTRPRPPGSIAALKARRELSESAKDRAENVMIVDLMRNDLGRVCEYGSIRAELPRSPQAHPGVWHMVAEVSGTLRQGITDSALLRATFPPGSVTGAPKIKAQEVISELESTGREVYTGAVGFAGPVAGLELNVAIRTFEVSRERIWLGAGSGIVADSEPGAEFAEALAKASPLVAAVGSRIRPAPGPRLRLGPAPVRAERPDPGRGIIETLLVADGEALELHAHIDRLIDSAAVLYGREIDRETLAAAIASAACGEVRARARVMVPASSEGEEEYDVTLAPIAAAPSPLPAVELRPATIPGGLGSHKWADRDLVNALAPEHGQEALICDIDGAVLESGSGNVWIAEGEVLITPALDGRLLGGVTREALIELAAVEGIEVRECEIGLDSLAEADEIFVTSSIRGLQTARLAGAPRPRHGSLSKSLAILLDARRRHASSISSSSSVGSTASSRTST